MAGTEIAMADMGMQQDQAEDPLDDYFAREEPAELVKELDRRADSTLRIRGATGYHKRLRKNRNLYYARPIGRSLGDDLGAGGEAGESIEVSINIARNLVRHIVSIITGVQAGVDLSAANTDPASIEKVDVGKSLAENKILKDALAVIDRGTEAAMVENVAYILGSWDDHAGGVWAAPAFDPNDPETPALIEQLTAAGRVHQISQGQDGWIQIKLYRGDLVWENVDPLEVFFDETATSWDDLDDMIVGTWRNRFDMMAKHPELAAEIKRAPSRVESLTRAETDGIFRHSAAMFESAWDSKIRVRHYFHKRTLAMPEGRHLIYVEGGPWLEDGPLETTQIPVFRISPDEMLWTPHGYCPITSMAGMQQVFDHVASSLFTNLFAFGKQTLVARKGSGITESDLGGMKLIEADFGPGGDSPVKVLDLLHVPEVMPRALEMIEKWMEGDSGVNAMVRGDPGGVTAGVAINLFTQMTQNFVGPAAKSRNHAIEQIVRFGFESYRNHPDVPRDLQITGKSKRPQLHEFYGDETEGLEGIKITGGNGFNETLQGKLQLFQQITQSKVEITKQEAAHLLLTGNPDVLLAGQAVQALNILAENEMIMSGQLPQVQNGENHLEHMMKHVEAVASPEARQNQSIKSAHDAHQQMHIAAMVKDPMFPVLYPQAAMQAFGGLQMGAMAIAQSPADPASAQSAMMPGPQPGRANGKPENPQRPPGAKPPSAQEAFGPPPLPPLPQVAPGQVPTPTQ